jgi:hypothetical protein
VTERCNICNWPLSNGGCEPDDCAYRPTEPREKARIAKRREDVANGCTCGPVDTTARECPVHWPAFTVRAIKAATSAANTVKDVLGTDRATFARTVATDTLNDMAAALIGRLPYIAQGVAQKVWSEVSAAIIERQVQRAVVQAPSLTVVDERTPGAPSSVELVDERG